MKLAMFVALLAQAGPGERFDLSCAGTHVTRSVSGYVSEPYASRFRVDLAALHWCEDSCRAVREIAGLGPATIAFEETGGAPDVDEVSHLLYRHTRRHFRVRYDRHNGFIRTNEWQGQCEYRPFSGFPGRLQP